jgi:GntR family transcriptional repressor for pyruvate dehydrogenase complex
VRIAADPINGRVPRRSAPKAAEKIAGAIRTDIVSGRVTDGEHLGSQNSLLKRFGVSKPTLREAFRVLEAESLIEIERGAYGGVIARHPDESHTTRALSTVLASRQVPLDDVYEARRVIECAATRLLAEAKTRKSKVKALERIIDAEQDGVGDPALFAASNVQFHEALVSAAGNQTLVLIAEVLHDIVSSEVTRLTKQDTTVQGITRRQHGIDAQRRLLELIAAGKQQEAEDYWREFMSVAGSIMLKSAARKGFVRPAPPRSA